MLLRMAIMVGVQPGGKGNFAVCSLYWPGHLPAVIFQSRSYAGVDEVLGDILGVSNEWGNLTQVAVAAPLTWSGSPSGWRACDRKLRREIPAWAPDTWLRAPNAMPGALSVQGPALVWALAKEVKLGNLCEHGVVETHPRLSLSRIAPNDQQAVLGYRDKEQTAAARRPHIATLLQRLTEPGMLRIDAEPPTSADELDALVCAFVALGVAVPEIGLVLSETPGGDIRPVGKRTVNILQALP